MSEHIADQIKAALEAQGYEWNNPRRADQDDQFSKTVAGAAEAGSLSDGTRVVRLTISNTGRWFCRVDGWGKLQREVDLRDHATAETAILAVMA